MKKPKKHIFMCCSFRAGGEPQGICHKKGSVKFLPYLENEIIERGMDGILVSASGCLKLCDRGPGMVIYPDNTWYGGFQSEDDIDEILDALEDGETCRKFLLVEE